MPKATLLQQSFSTGEVSPLYSGRVTEDRYKSGLETGLNLIPTLQGPAIARPGNKYSGQPKTASVPPVFIPYTYSLTTNYILEVGVGYIRFWNNNALVVNPNAYFQATTNSVIGEGINGFYTQPTTAPIPGASGTTYASISAGSVLELPNPYQTQGELSGLRYFQDKANLYILHNNYCLMQLTFIDGQFGWGLQYYQTQDGPYMGINSYYTPADGFPLNGTVISLTPDTALSQNAFNLYTGPLCAVTGAANNGSGLIRITCSGGHPYVTGQQIFLTGIGGTTEANNIAYTTASTFGTYWWYVTVINSTTFDLVGSTFTHTYTSGGTAYPALFFNELTLGQATSRVYLGVGRVIGLVDPITGLRYSGTVMAPPQQANMIQVKLNTAIVNGGLNPSSQLSSIRTTVSSATGSTITVAAIGGVLVGAFINCLNVPTGTYVQSIAGSVVTLSQAPTGTPSGPITFTVPTSYWYFGCYTPRYQIAFGSGPTIVQFNAQMPAVGCFHQDRMALSASPLVFDQIDLSMTSQYGVFSPSTVSPIPGIQATAGQTIAMVVADNNAIQFRLLSREANPIRWLASTAQGLLTGTYEGEWCITPDSNSAALSPTNLNALESSSFGSSSADAVSAGNAVLYVQRAGRKVREMNFFFQVGTFRSTDLTELSEHLTVPSIVKLAVQKETHPIVWALRSDGVLLSMVYNRDDFTLKAGWTPHQLGGQSDSGGSPPIVLSMAVIPDPTTSFDQLWILVQRWINGASVVTVEYMTHVFDDSVLQEDAFQLDCGFTYYQPKEVEGISTATTAVVTANGHGFSNGDAVKFSNITGLNKTITDVNGNTTLENLVNEQTFTVAGATTNTFQLNDFSGNPISSVGFSPFVDVGGSIPTGQVAKLVTQITGLTVLENETVSILADGGAHPPATISNSGVLTLEYPAAKVQLGYPYNSDGKLLIPEAGSAEGSSIGQTRRVNKVAFRVYRTGGLQFGVDDFKSLVPAEFSRADQNQADVAVPLYSGIYRENVESEYNFENQLCFRLQSPLPGMIQSITTFFEEQDV